MSTLPALLLLVLLLLLLGAGAARRPCLWVLLLLMRLNGLCVCARARKYVVDGGRDRGQTGRARAI
jgi:hypothetical protein